MIGCHALHGSAVLSICRSPEVALVVVVVLVIVLAASHRVLPAPSCVLDAPGLATAPCRPWGRGGGGGAGAGAGAGGGGGGEGGG
eukprot:scaffold93183_cov48-Phaeocystis_antarctica.AAC.1